MTRSVLTVVAERVSCLMFNVVASSSEQQQITPGIEPAISVTCLSAALSGGVAWQQTRPGIIHSLANRSDPL